MTSIPLKIKPKVLIRASDVLGNLGMLSLNPRLLPPSVPFAAGGGLLAIPCVPSFFLLWALHMLSPLPGMLFPRHPHHTQPLRQWYLLREAPWSHYLKELLPPANVYSLLCCTFFSTRHLSLPDIILCINTFGCLLPDFSIHL